MGKVKNQRKMNPTPLEVPTRIQPEVMPKPGKAGVYTNQMHFFKKHLLDELPKKQFASHFMKPVDAQEPNYYSIIQRPMDVGTIAQRVENNYYRDVGGAIEDFRLLIRNCFQFNKADSMIYRKGIQLEKFFLRTIEKIPKGQPVPCNKEPKATSQLQANSMTEAMEQECRDMLKRLETSTSEAEAKVRNFFRPKWVSLSKKLDKQGFKSKEEFRSQVNGIFEKYYGMANMIYEQVYDQPGGFRDNDSSTSASTSGRAADASNHFSAFETTALLQEIQLMQPRLKEFLNQPHKAKSLSDTLAQFKAKVEAIKASAEARILASNKAGEEQGSAAAAYLSADVHDFLVNAQDADL